MSVFTVRNPNNVVEDILTVWTEIDEVFWQDIEAEPLCRLLALPSYVNEVQLQQDIIRTVGAGCWTANDNRLLVFPPNAEDDPYEAVVMSILGLWECIYEVLGRDIEAEPLCELLGFVDCANLVAEGMSILRRTRWMCLVDKPLLRIVPSAEG